MDYQFQQETYLLRRKVFRIFGASFSIFNEKGELQFYVNQKAFKLREDIRVYSSLNMSNELLFIKARNIIDFSSVYDVFDQHAGEKVGSLKRKGLKSMLRDEWIIMDANGNEIGKIEEESMGLALVRRFLLNLIPQSFVGKINGRDVFHFTQKFNPFIQKIKLDFTIDRDKVLDRRLGIAAGILICAIEGRQQ